MKNLTPLQLFISFSKIGMSGFGGVLPWARRTLVEKDQILTSEEFSAILGICQIVPGPNIVNLAAELKPYGVDVLAAFLVYELFFGFLT